MLCHLLHLFPSSLPEAKEVLSHMVYRIGTLSGRVCHSQWTNEILQACHFPRKVTVYLIFCRFYYDDIALFIAVEKQSLGDNCMCDPGNMLCVLHRLLFSLWSPGSSFDYRSCQIPGGKLAHCIVNLRKRCTAGVYRVNG